MSHFQAQLGKYADLFVKVGLNLQPGQTLVLGATHPVSLEHAPLVRMITERAYDAGAPKVLVNWQDELITRYTYERATVKALDDFPVHLANWYLELADGNAAFGSIGGSSPDLLSGVDPSRVNRGLQATRRGLQGLAAKTSRMEVTWVGMVAPTEGWATKLYPHLSVSEAIDRLWDRIFTACRIDRPDPTAEWQTHMATLQAGANRLTEQQYRALYFRAPGTDLIVELPVDHRWMSVGGQTNASGISFVCRICPVKRYSPPPCARV
jgi:aminopeptidase